jgi:hypothetical protein
LINVRFISELHSFSHTFDVVSLSVMSVYCVPMGCLFGLLDC